MKNFFEDLKKKYELFRFPVNALVMLLSVFTMACIIIVPLSKTWSGRQDYSFGYIMPMFCLYVLYDRFPLFSKYFLKPSGEVYKKSIGEIFCNLFFGAMFACGILTYLMGLAFYVISKNFGAPTFIATFGFSFSFFAMAYFAGQFDSLGNRKNLSERLRFTGLFTFPAFAWIIAAPLFDIFEQKISLFLLGKVAVVVYNIMDMFGYIVTLNANVLTFPNGSVGVADACSGIRSLTACLFAGSFLASTFVDKFWKKITMVALSMVFAFFFNILRAMFLSFWAYYNGPDSISGFVHDAAGYFVLGMTALSLMALIPLFSLNPVPKEFRNQNPYNKAREELENENVSE